MKVSFFKIGGNSFLLSLIFSAFCSYVILRIAWNDWTIFAAMWSALYLMGGFRFFPWNTPIQKGIHLGLIAATAMAMVEFLLKISD